MEYTDNGQPLRLYTLRHQRLPVKTVKGLGYESGGHHDNPGEVVMGPGNKAVTALLLNRPSTGIMMNTHHSEKNDFKLPECYQNT